MPRLSFNMHQKTFFLKKPKRGRKTGTAVLFSVLLSLASAAGGAFSSVSKARPDASPASAAEAAADRISADRISADWLPADSGPKTRRLASVAVADPAELLGADPAGSADPANSAGPARSTVLEKPLDEARLEGARPAEAGGNPSAQDGGGDHPPEASQHGAGPPRFGPPEGWKKEELFSNSAGLQIFISERSPEIIASLNRAPVATAPVATAPVATVPHNGETRLNGSPQDGPRQERAPNGPLPETNTACQIFVQKKQALEKIPSIDQWILESCSYDKQNKTLSANGRLIRRGRPVFFKERLFYPDFDRSVQKFLF